MSTRPVRVLGVASAGTSLGQLILAHSLLKASTGLTRETWRLATGESSDVSLEFVDIALPQGAALQAREKHSRPSLRIGASVSARAFASALDAASNELGSRADRPIRQTRAGVADGSLGGLDERIDAVRLALRGDVGVEIRTDRGVWLRTAPSAACVKLRKEGADPVQAIRAFLGAMAEDGQFSVRQALDLETQPGADSLVLPNEWFLWALGWEAAASTPVEVDAAATFRFIRWPDFTRIPRDSSLIRMAGALSGKPISLAELQQRADVHRAVALRALNAGRMLGILATTASQASDRTPAPDGARNRRGMSGFLSRLRRALHQRAMPG